MILLSIHPSPIVFHKLIVNRPQKKRRPQFVASTNHDTSLCMMNPFHRYCLLHMFGVHRKNPVTNSNIFSFLHFSFVGPEIFIGQSSSVSHYHASRYVRDKQIMSADIQNFTRHHPRLQVGHAIAQDWTSILPHYIGHFRKFVSNPSRTVPEIPHHIKLLLPQYGNSETSRF